MSFHVSPKASSCRVNHQDVRSELIGAYIPAHGIQGVGERNNVDPSGKLWSLYVEEAEPYDKALVERWKGSMDGILIFAGLFSASVTAFIVESYKMLQQTSGDATVLLLHQISRQLSAMANGSHIEIPVQPVNQLPFRPTSSALRVNAFWFLSLGSGLACALSATLVEQWARNYLQAVQRRPAPHKRARISSYLYTGLKKFGMAKVAGVIPTLLHVALFLFFAGLVEFLLPINSIIAYLTLTILILCTGLYVIATFLPLLFTNCPYETPLSEYFWKGLQPCLSRYRPDRPAFTSMERAREVDAMMASPTRDQRDCDALRWTLESLTEDFEFQPFVEGIPGFLRSKNNTAFHGLTVITRLLKDPAVGLANRIKLLLRTCKDSHQTISSDSRRRRALACMDAIWSITVHSCQADPSLGADWNMWCHENLANLVKTFKSDPDAVVANSAFSVTTVLVHQLLYDHSIVPIVTEADLERLQRCIYSGENVSAEQLGLQLKYDLRMAGTGGLEALETADWLIREEWKDKIHDLKRELPLAIENAMTELNGFLSIRGATAPSKAIRASLSTMTAIAMSMMMTGHGTKPPPIQTRQAMHLLNQLHDILDDIRFELLVDYASKLREKTPLSEKAIHTLGLVMFDLPFQIPSHHTQARLVDSLEQLVKYDRSLGSKGVMGPAIDRLFDVVHHLDEEVPMQRAADIARSYLEAHPFSRAAYDACVFLDRSPLSS